MADYFNRQSPWSSLGEMSYGVGSGVAQALASLPVMRAQSREAGARAALYGAQTGFYRTKSAVAEAQAVDEREVTFGLSRAYKDLVLAGQAQDPAKATEASGRVAEFLGRLVPYNPQLANDFQKFALTATAGGFGNKAIASSMIGGDNKAAEAANARGVVQSKRDDFIARKEKANNIFRSDIDAANAKVGATFNKEEHAKEVQAAREKYEKAMDALQSPSLGEDDGMGERLMPRGPGASAPSANVQPMPQETVSQEDQQRFGFNVDAPQMEAPAVTAPPMRSTQMAPATDEWRTTSKGTRVRVVSQPQTSTEGFQVPKGFGEAVTQQIPQPPAPNFIQGTGTPNPDVQQFPATPNFVRGVGTPNPNEQGPRALAAEPMPIVRAFEDSNGRRPSSLREAAEWAHIKGYITTEELQAMLK